MYWTSTALQALREFGNIRFLKSGDAIEATNHHIILSGVIKAGRVSNNKIVDELRFFWNGDVIPMNEEAENHSRRLAAMSHTTICTLTDEVLGSLIWNHPEVGKEYIRNLSRMLNFQNRYISFVRENTSTERVAGVLLGLAQRKKALGDTVVNIPFPAKYLATMLQVNSSTLSRSFQELKMSDLAHKVGPKAFHLPNAARLSSVAEPLQLP